MSASGVTYWRGFAEGISTFTTGFLMAVVTSVGRYNWEGMAICVWISIADPGKTKSDWTGIKLVFITMENSNKAIKLYDAIFISHTLLWNMPRLV